MIHTAVSIALGLFGLAMVMTAWRLMRGPDLLDRVLAMDTLYVNALAVVLLLGIRYRTQLLFESALVIAALGFIATVVLARFAERLDTVGHRD